jgi:hypothetical protein
METNVQGLDVSPNDAKRVLPAVSIEEAAEIIQALYEYGQIHTVKGVIYGESHERYLNRAMTWLHFYRSSKNGR